MQAREENAGGENGDEPTQTKKRSKPAQPLVPARSFTTGDEGIDLGADGIAKSLSQSDENNSENGGEMDTDEAADGELASPTKEAKDGTWAGNTEMLLDYLFRRKGRTEGWKRLRETETEDVKVLDVGGDWPWADKTALEVRRVPPSAPLPSLAAHAPLPLPLPPQEEFISMNDRHRRESNTAPPPNLHVLVH
jgi:hypothetical protein